MIIGQHGKETKPLPHRTISTKEIHLVVHDDARGAGARARAVTAALYFAPAAERRHLVIPPWVVVAEVTAAIVQAFVVRSAPGVAAAVPVRALRVEVGHVALHCPPYSTGVETTSILLKRPEYKTRTSVK